MSSNLQPSWPLATMTTYFIIMTRRMRKDNKMTFDTICVENCSFSRHSSLGILHIDTKSKNYCEFPPPLPPDIFTD